MSEIDGDVFGFERLDVWQRSADFAAAIYDLTSSFPKQEMFGLIMQLRRAAVSISADIAEGNTRTTGKDKARFFEIAYGSLSEVASMLRVAERVGFVRKDAHPAIRSEAVRIGRMLSGLKKAVLVAH